METPSLREPVELVGRYSACKAKVVALSDDGALVVMWSPTVGIAAYLEEQPLWTRKTEDGERCLSVCCTRAIVAVALGPRVLVLDAADGSPQRTLQHSEEQEVSVCGVACSADGCSVASAAEDGSLRLWHDGSCVDLHYAAEEAAEEDPLLAGCISEDLSKLLSNGPLERNALRCCAFGQALAAAGDSEEIYVWDLKEAGAPAVVTGHKSSVCALAWGPNGLASMDAEGRVIMWSADYAETTTFVAHEAISGCRYYRGALKFSPCGLWLATAAQDAVKVWGLKGAGQEAGLAIAAHEVLPKEAGLVIAAHEDTASFLPKEAGLVIAAHEEKIQAAALAFLPTGQFVCVTAGRDGRVLVCREDAASFLACVGRPTRAQFDGSDLLCVTALGARAWRCSPRLSYARLPAASMMAISSTVVAAVDDNLESAVRISTIEWEEGGLYSRAEVSETQSWRRHALYVGFAWDGAVLTYDGKEVVVASSSTGEVLRRFPGALVDGPWRYVELAPAVETYFEEQLKEVIDQKAATREPAVWCLVSHRGGEVVALDPSGEVSVLRTLPAAILQTLAVAAPELRVLCRTANAVHILRPRDGRLSSIDFPGIKVANHAPLNVIAWSGTALKIWRDDEDMRYEQIYSLSLVQPPPAPSQQHQRHIQILDASLSSSWIFLVTAKGWLHSIKLPDGPRDDPPQVQILDK